jgi:hypothetical protein
VKFEKPKKRAFQKKKMRESEGVRKKELFRGKKMSTCKIFAHIASK